MKDKIKDLVESLLVTKLYFIVIYFKIVIEILFNLVNYEIK